MLKEYGWALKRIADANLKDSESIKVNWGGVESLEIYRKNNEIVIEKWIPVSNSPDDFNWDFEELISFKI